MLHRTDISPYRAIYIERDLFCWNMNYDTTSDGAQNTNVLTHNTHALQYQTASCLTCARARVHAHVSSHRHVHNSVLHHVLRPERL